MLSDLIDTISNLLRAHQLRSVPDALRRILGRKRLAEVLLSSPDRRHLVEISARSQGISESDLLLKISEQLGLPYLSRVLPADITILDAATNISAFRTAGAIPVTSEGMITGIVCTDPALVAPLVERLRIGHVAQVNLPLFLAAWLDIARALDQSEKVYLAAKSQREASAIARSGEMAKKVAALLCDEAEAAGATGLQIEFAEQPARYSFINSAGQEASGTIDARIREQLKSYLIESAASPSFTLLTYKSSKELTVSVSCVGASLRLDWSKAAEVCIENQGADNSLEGAKVINFPNVSVTRVEEKPTNLQLNKTGELVLVVDDNVTFAKVLEKFLGRHGYKIKHAESGEAALKMLESGKVKPEMVVCDVHMPMMNGFEFLKRFRNDLRFSNTPILMLTSDDDVETELKLLGDGADAFVTKNEDPRLLCVQVKRLIEKSRTKQAA